MFYIMRIVFIIFVILLLTVEGITQQNCRDCGVAFMRFRIYKPELDVYILPKYERDTKYFFMIAC